MNIQEIQNKRAIDVTVDELATVIAEKLLNSTVNKERKMLNGIQGIMKIVQCSRSKATRLKASGILDDAITPVGKSFLLDADKALDLLKNKKQNRKYAKGFN